MFNKRGQVTTAVVLMIIAVLIGAGLIIGNSIGGSELGSHNSPYSVDSVVAKCKLDCNTASNGGSKFEYCSGLKTVKSPKETLRDVTCIYLLQNRPEYNLEKCDKVNCGEEEPRLKEDVPPVSSTRKKDEPPTPTTGVNLQLDCKGEIIKLLTKYSDGKCEHVSSYSATDYPGYKLPNFNKEPIPPLLFQAILMQENPKALVPPSCSFEPIGSDKISMGIMQIVPKGKYGVCQEKDHIRAKYNLPPVKIKNEEECAKLLQDEIEKNIEVASIILREKYLLLKDPDKLPEEYEPIQCTITNSKKEQEVINIKYYGWEAALRGYNSWPKSSSDKNQLWTCEQVRKYVDEVKAKCKNLNGNKDCLDSKGNLLI